MYLFSCRHNFPVDSNISRLTVITHNFLFHISKSNTRIGKMTLCRYAAEDRKNWVSQDGFNSFLIILFSLYENGIWRQKKKGI